MTDAGRSYVLSRLSDAPDLAALRRVWESLGVEYQRDPAILSHKDTLKKQMEAANATRTTP